MHVLVMSELTMIHGRKQSNRPHHIPEWAEKRGLRQADIALEIGADKGMVSRWFKGATPTIEYQEKLAALFQCASRESLFIHPDEGWFKSFFEGWMKEEVEKMKATLEAAFPRRKTG